MNAPCICQCIQVRSALTAEVWHAEWVLPAGVVAVTLLSILSGYLLQPGADAQEEIRKRDERSGRFR